MLSARTTLWQFHTGLAGSGPQTKDCQGATRHQGRVLGERRFRSTHRSFRNVHRHRTYHPWMPQHTRGADGRQMEGQLGNKRDHCQPCGDNMSCLCASVATVLSPGQAAEDTLQSLLRTGSRNRSRTPRHRRRTMECLWRFDTFVGAQRSARHPHAVGLLYRPCTTGRLSFRLFLRGRSPSGNHTEDR